MQVAVVVNAVGVGVDGRRRIRIGVRVGAIVAAGAVAGQQQQQPQ